MTVLVTIILQESIAATCKITIPFNRSWEELLSANISLLSNTYKPNYKELEIELLGTLFSSMMDHIHLKLDIQCLPSIGLQSV